MDAISARRVKLSLLIGGHDAASYVEPTLLEFEYTDNASGKSDEVQLTLHDRDGKWNGPWRPGKGTAVSAVLTVRDWFGPGEHASLNCGAFKIDEIKFSGPPDKVTIKAVSASLTDGLRDEKRTKAWENHSLRGIAQEVAGKEGLELLYRGSDHNFGRRDQREESDIAFLQRLGTDVGMNVKVHNGKLVLFDAEAADARAPGLTIVKGGGPLCAARYSFEEKSSGTAYSACEVVYRDPASGKTLKYSYPGPGDGKKTRKIDATQNAASSRGSKSGKGGVTGKKGQKVLRVNKRVESLAEAAKLAKASLRKGNKGETKANIEVMGHPGLVAGMTVRLSGFAAFDGAYFVEKSAHKVGSGYATSVELRKVLEY